MEQDPSETERCGRAAHVVHKRDSSVHLPANLTFILPLGADGSQPRLHCTLALHACTAADTGLNFVGTRAARPSLAVRYTSQSAAKLVPGPDKPADSRDRVEPFEHNRAMTNDVIATHL
jgi:hypothetical protein